MTFALVCLAYLLPVGAVAVLLDYFMGGWNVDK